MAASGQWRAPTGYVQPMHAGQTGWGIQRKELHCSSCAVDIALSPAAGADHVREVHVGGAFTDTRWTLQLRPVWLTWYRDDDGTARVLRVDGGTGVARGPRMMSPRRARRAAAALGAVGAACGVSGAALGLLGIVLVPLLAFAGVLMVLTVLALVAALVPLLAPQRHNRAQAALPPVV